MTDDEALAELVAAMQRRWDAMPAEERAEVERKQAAGRERIRERNRRIFGEDSSEGNADGN